MNRYDPVDMMLRPSPEREGLPVDDPNKALTCNRWRRTGNIANRTMAYNMRANTEMSSGNRDPSTTDAHMAALMESTDVRLHDATVKMLLRVLKITCNARAVSHLSRV
jgi:hypothetical protein